MTSLMPDDVQTSSDGAPSDEVVALPTSFAQERLWFAEQFDPGSTLYNIPFAVRLGGQLDVASLERSLNEIIRRHEALRTVFASQDGQPLQVIEPTVTVDLTPIDISEQPPTAREAAAEHLARAEAVRPFDLVRGPLLRASLVRLADDDHLLLLAMHHIVSDGWSMEVLFRELATLYQDFAAGRGASLPELAIQYADFAIWQREWLQGESLEAQLDYWRAHLAGAPAALELPTDHPRPAFQTFRGAIHSFELPRGPVATIEALARREGATPFMALLAIYAYLLRRYTDRDEVVIGTPIAGRTRAEVEGLIGFFANTLALRVDLAGEPSFRELLRRVREVALGAYAHQDLPFERLVEALQPERNLSHSPLFQVMFALQTAPREPVELPGLTISAVETHNGTAPFELTLTLVETSDGLRGTLEYNADLFEPATVARLAGHYTTLLEGVAGNPDRCVADLPLLSAAELDELAAWNATAADYPRDLCVQQLIEQQARQNPRAPAVVDGATRLRYGDLNGRANQLARRLRALGVGPEDRVGVCFERSADLIVAELAVLKAGAAYLPLDPAYPADRLVFMLDDAAAAALITNERLAPTLRSATTPTIRVDAERAVLEAESDADLAPLATPDNAAYVIYTSGSTGRPKGTIVEHRSLLNFVCWHLREYGVTAADRATQVAGPSFDVSIWDIWPHLAVGASVHIPDDETRASPERLRDWLVEQAITISFLPTPLAEAVLDLAWPTDLALRTLLTAGDRLRRYPPSGLPFRLVNGYGPTENTVITTATIVPPNEAADAAPSIGRPIANNRVYVLDGSLRPLPVGVPGELWIGGESLARGYLNRPDLTAERFVPDPFSAEPGARMYGSGDLVRFLAGGDIEFLGRLDHQVKLRGHRIELGEIEAVLSQHTAVQAALLQVREDGRGEQHLVAYLVGRPGASPAIDKLRAYLKQRLPEYMVPTTFVPLEAFPLTPNGKVDRRILPAPDAIGRRQAVRTAPRTPTEQALAEIWAEMLGIAEPDVCDSFFDLGGHSLLATRLLSRVRDASAVEVPLRDFFSGPTIAALAEAVDAATLASAGPSDRSFAIPRRSEAGPPPCSFAQQRMWFADQLEPGSPLYNITLAVHLHGDVDPDVLERSLNEIVRRHEALRTTFGVREGEPIQIIAPTCRLELPVADLRALPAAERAAEQHRLASELAGRAFQLASGPLLRALLIRSGETESVLVLAVHHIVSDGWSMDVLVGELATHYDAFVDGLPSPLAELPIQYADYAVWQREWLAGDRLQAQLDYWREQLAHAPAVLDLPTDRPRPAVQTHRGAAHAFELPTELTRALEALCRAEGVTEFQALLAAFQALLQRYSGQDRVVVGSPIAGRTRAEVEGLIGLFVNTLVLHTDLSGNPTFRELLRRVREVTLGAYAHQELPFERLVEALQPERSLSHTPLFQVMFTFDPSRPEGPRLAGAPIWTAEVDTGTAKNNLILALTADGPALRGEIEYNADLFDAETIARLAGHFTTLLAGAVADPTTRLENLPLLTEAERQQLEALNATEAEYRAGACLHELIATQAAATPDAPAVTYQDERLTYAELNRRANQLAHELRARGVEPEERVAICMERSVDLIVAVLGVLKAGAAYVPIDPTNPRERLSYMLHDSRARVVLTGQRLAARLPLDPERTLCLDRDTELIEQQPTYDPFNRTLPINTAYVIYTSGSTGWPKGVACQHEGVVSFTADCDRRAPLRVGDRHALWTNMSFDVSVYDIFGALLTGAALDLVPEEVRPVSTAFFDWLAERRITSTYIPPFMLGDLPAWLERNPGRLVLRKVLVGVEPIPEQLLVRTMRQIPGLRIINGYGPTEATVACTIYPIDLDSAHERNAPIGRPIGNTRIHLLDRAMQPVPIGVPGELYIGGVGLARGYLDRPDLTADRFVPNPFSAEPGARLYRTGDLARYLSDGNVEFLGRIDHQIKLRGFRIELGEIEAALEGRDEIREALVIAREDTPGDKRLVAYLVMADGATLPGTTALRAYLKERLPDYMVPAAFVSLDRLPLSPNGKLDRKGLPAPPTERAEGGAEYAPPGNDLERTIAGAWCEVLGLERVGVADNFFDLGGHSLLVVRLQTRLRELLGRNLSIVELFQHSTVAALAQHLGRSAPDVAAIHDGQERAATRLELRAQRRDTRLRRTGPGA